MKTTRNQYHYQIRRYRRVEDYIRNQKMIENGFNSDFDLFAEIKKQRFNEKNDN